MFTDSYLTGFRHSLLVETGIWFPLPSDALADRPPDRPVAATGRDGAPTGSGRSGPGSGPTRAD